MLVPDWWPSAMRRGVRCPVFALNENSLTLFLRVLSLAPQNPENIIEGTGRSGRRKVEAGGEYVCRYMVDRWYIYNIGVHRRE